MCITASTTIIPTKEKHDKNTHSLPLLAPKPDGSTNDSSPSISSDDSLVSNPLFGLIGLFAADKRPLTTVVVGIPGSSLPREGEVDAVDAGVEAGSRSGDVGAGDAVGDGDCLVTVEAVVAVLSVFPCPKLDERGGGGGGGTRLTAVNLRSDVEDDVRRCCCCCCSPPSALGASPIPFPTLPELVCI